MPMRYANATDVYAALKIDAVSMDAEDVAYRERVIRVENGLAANFDEQVNTSFGVAPTAETRTVWSSGAYWFNSWYPEFGFYDWPVSINRSPTQMILSTRVRSISAIRTGGDWNGTTWDDDDLVPITDYALNYYDAKSDGYWGIQALSGVWAGIYRITGVWADQSSATVPDDVREALTFLTIDQYRILESSPSGSLGPDNLVIQTRNAWAFRSVQSAINRHRVIELIV